MKTFEEFIIEGKKTDAKGIVSYFLKNKNDWPDFYLRVKALKSDTIEIIDSYHVNGKKALQNLKTDWEANGPYAKFFNEEFGIKFKLIAEDMFTQSDTPWHKKFTKSGVVSITLKIS